MSTRRLALLAMCVPALRLLIDLASDIPGAFNDYHQYWLAGRLVANGHDPYDVLALMALAQQEGFAFLVGTGYSYPPVFAVLMVPLSALPFGISVGLFSALSLVVFGLAVAKLIGHCQTRLARTAVARALLAIAAGAYAPIAGSLFVGQVNLLVFGLLAAGFVALGARRPAPAGIAFGLAAVVKLVPISLTAPLLLARRHRVVLAFAAAVGTSLGCAALVAPYALSGSGALLALLEPDAYWTNQSLNGLITRALQHSPQTSALVPTGLVVAVATMVLAGLTAAVIWRVRARLVDTKTLLVAEAFALVAATLGAPKNSFWNQTPALLGAWVLICYGRELTRVDRLLLAIWYVGAYLQPHANLTADQVAEPLGWLVNLLTSSAFFGVLALWAALAWRLLASDNHSSSLTGMTSNTC